MKDPTTDDDDLDFQSLMADVDPIKHDRADLKKPRRSRKDLDYRRAAAVTDSEKFDRGLSDELRSLVSSEEELIYAQPGIQLREMKKLKRGQIPWQEGIDLHGYTVEQAREELGKFIHQGYRRGLRSVIVVHGKAFNEDGTPAILKSHTNDWLKQMHQVLAFVSAQPQDGGTGALYVLLKKPPQHSR